MSRHGVRSFNADYDYDESLIPSERACPIAAKMAKSLNNSRSHYSYNQYPYPGMEQPPEYPATACPCPMGICL